MTQVPGSGLVSIIAETIKVSAVLFQALMSSEPPPVDDDAESLLELKKVTPLPRLALFSWLFHKLISL